MIYSVYPLMNNHCYCNTVYTIKPDTKVMEVRAQRRIKTGEEISTRYVLPSMEQPTRLEYIKKVWDFICRCDRCQSPSELGSMFSGLKCGQCLQGYCLPGRAGELQCDWRCEECGGETPHQEVGAVLARCRALVTKVAGVEDAETLLTSLQHHLHPNHGLCVQLRTQLISSYDQLEDKSRAQLDRQLQLAQQVLAVTDIIDPGLTPRRGGLLKHVLELRTRTANMDKKQGVIDKERHMDILRSNMGMVKEIMQCMKYATVYKI